MNIVKAVKDNYGKYLARAAGGVVLFHIAKDSHTVGKLQSDVTAQSRDANVCMDFFENSQRLDNPSLTKSKIKDKIFKFQLNSNFLTFFNSAIGYFSGLTQNLVSNVIGLTLGSTALFAKNKKIACSSGIGLGIFALYSFLKDGLGLGTTKFLQK